MARKKEETQIETYDDKLCKKWGESQTELGKRSAQNLEDTHQNIIRQIVPAELEREIWNYLYEELLKMIVTHFPALPKRSQTYFTHKIEFESKWRRGIEIPFRRYWQTGDDMIYRIRNRQNYGQYVLNHETFPSGETYSYYKFIGE